jgi:hypothetical protein
VKSARNEYLDHLFVLNETHLRQAPSAYVTHFNYWHPHRSLGQRAPCESGVLQFRPREANCKITAEPVLGQLHHIYRRAAWRPEDGIIRRAGSRTAILAPWRCLPVAG